MVTGGLALLLLGFVLGLRHGVDWDHIAAITDITSSVVTTEEVTGQVVAVGANGLTAARTIDQPSKKWQETRRGFVLATLYALGHASVVMLLGLLAIWIGAVLPAWIDPVMEAVVGVTLVTLGVWIFYSLWRYGQSFRLQSRWMVVLALVGRAWTAAQRKLSGRAGVHGHDHPLSIAQYSSNTAFGVGVIHGIGAETGSQALLLAGAAGATTPQSGSLMLLAFTVGLVLSNSLIAMFSLVGFVSSSTKRNVYVVVGVIAGIFSLVIGVFFLSGHDADLPDLQAVLNVLFGAVQQR